jgi:hypothetical protein
MDAPFICRRRAGRRGLSRLNTEVVDARSGDVVAVARPAAAGLIADVLERTLAGERWPTPPYRLYHANKLFAFPRSGAIVRVTASDSILVAEARDEPTAERIADLLSRAEWPKAAEKNRGRIRVRWW